MKRLADQTLYEVLEVPPDAGPPAIAAAYERARSLYGPGSLATYTLMDSEEAALMTSRIEEAKITLLDAEARARYDASLGAPGRAAKHVAGENGAPQSPPFAALPPVIPALQLPAEPPPAPSPPPADRLRAVAEAEPVPPPAAPPPAPAARSPILLEREIPDLRVASPALPAAPPAAPTAEVPMPEGASWTGEALRRVREARGLTVQQIAERTKVTRHHVENIEAERFSALPAPVYLRGILLTMARELRLDGQKVARAYLERAGVTAGHAAGRAR